MNIGKSKNIDILFCNIWDIIDFRWLLFSSALLKLKFLRHVTARPPGQMVFPIRHIHCPVLGAIPTRSPIPKGRDFPPDNWHLATHRSSFLVPIHLDGCSCGWVVGWVAIGVGDTSVACCRVWPASAAVATCSCPSPFINISAEIRNVLRLASGRTRPQLHSQDSNPAWSHQEPGGTASSTGTKPST